MYIKVDGNIEAKNVPNLKNCMYPFFMSLKGIFLIIESSENKKKNILILFLSCIVITYFVPNLLFGPIIDYCP